jgi:hypothetical protein
MHLLRPLTTLLLFVCFTARVLPAQSQPDVVNHRVTTEVGGVTLPSTQSIYVAAMECPDFFQTTPEQTAVYRSTAGGAWQELFRIGIDANYDRAPDPIMACDAAGTLYLELMRIPPSGGFISHVVLYSSTDQGTTWQLKSFPYEDPAFGDYPAILAWGNGMVATTYTEYTFSGLDSWVEFRRSSDGGVTWTAPLRFDGDRSMVGSNFITVGSDLAWVGNRLCLTYGDYTFNHVYFTSSLDSGLTWAPVDTIDLVDPDYFQITKLVPFEDSDTLFALSHRPHDDQAEIHLCTSYDEGQSWNAQIVATNAAYAEAMQSGPGVLDLVYNETDNFGYFYVRYKWSEDAGQTFSSPVTLWTAARNRQGAGEYQAFMPAASGVGFDLTFVDDSDSSELKYIHFTHALSTSTDDPAASNIRIYPNPTRDIIKVHITDPLNAPTQYRLCDLQGKILQQGALQFPQTELDFRDFASGPYLILLEQGNRIEVRKVIRE